MPDADEGQLGERSQGGEVVEKTRKREGRVVIKKTLGALYVWGNGT